MPRSRLTGVTRITVGGLGLAAVLYLVLAIPTPAPTLPSAPVGARSFVWDQDSLWRTLEATFVEARAAGCAETAGLRRELSTLRVGVGALDRAPLLPTAPEFDAVESSIFRVAPLVAACGGSMDEFVALYASTRAAVKSQSRHWDVGSTDARNRLYRSLYGGRAAVEEAMLQHPEGIVTLLAGTNEPSATPAAMSNGVEVHSGDIIVSRGGAPTSALIARGNDYPGNFSHVALVHVDAVTHVISVIEAHIEVGVVIATLDEYLADRKLRMMLLRPRSDLAAMQQDPMLPHRAATAVRDRARAGHIPYDFTMDYRDPSRLFCSEVASSAYHDAGVDLWMGISTISGTGLRRWLGSFGVRHFETQEPSDLEYDPQLVVVGEWRDPESLFQDHIDNAVTDVMLEGAERGDAIEYAWSDLPLARLIKARSRVEQLAGRRGTIPQGMSAGAALRNRAYSGRHAQLSASVREAAEAWTVERGYRPPYWKLVELARSRVADQAD